MYVYSYLKKFTVDEFPVIPLKATTAVVVAAIVILLKKTKKTKT